MASLVVKTFDTFPAWVFSCSDANGWVAIAGNTTAIKLVGKGQSSNTILGPDTATAVTEVTPTGNLVSGSNSIQSVSAFTGVSLNSTLTGAGIPANAVVGSFDSTAGTITMVDATTGAAANATKTATGETLTINRGQVTYTPTTVDTGTADIYPVELSVTWTAGGVQKFPNAAANNPTIQIDNDLDGASG